MTAIPLIHDGKPLRFLAVVLGAWVGARVALLWLPDIAPEIVTPPPRAAPARHFARPNHTPAPAPAPVRVERSPETHAPRPRPFLDDARNERVGQEAPPPFQSRPAYPPPTAHPSPPIDGIFAAPVALTPPHASSPNPPRWSVSAWALLRGSGGTTSVATPQLGGSQIGARIAYRLDTRGRVAAVVRAAAAVGTRQQEAAIGVEWRPTELPVRLVAERRIGVANIRGGFAIGAVGGVDQLPLAAGVRLDGYAQGGVIARDGGVGYVDGALRAGRRVTPAIDLGLGAWGAAQPGAARIDLGPSAVVRLPMRGTAIRVGAEWRQRVAGNARPASGPVIALGMDF